MSPLPIGRSLLSSTAAAWGRRLLAPQLRRGLSSAKLPTGNSLELGFYYRHPGVISPNQKLIMEGFGAFVWFYLLYHTYHYPQMVIGHPSYPNPRKWTDAELGIPPE